MKIRVDISNDEASIDIETADHLDQIQEVMRSLPKVIESARLKKEETR